jgi:lipopolysaccharide biosynthesis glycosyltransferase
MQQGTASTSLGFTQTQMSMYRILQMSIYNNLPRHASTIQQGTASSSSTAAPPQPPLHKYTTTPLHKWVKLVLGHAVSHRTERALYLDTDVLVLGDVSELMRASKGAIMCAAPDFGFPPGHEELPAQVWDPLLCAYFNAGRRLCVCVCVSFRT